MGMKCFSFGVALLLGGSFQLAAQYDKVAALGSDASITPIGGPASSPPVESTPYNLPDARPTGLLNDQLPKWLQFGVEERFRFEGYTNTGFKPGANDSYMLNRLRVGMILKPVNWFTVYSQVQDAAFSPEAANRSSERESLGSEAGVCGDWKPGDQPDYGPGRPAGDRLQQHHHC